MNSVKWLISFCDILIKFTPKSSLVYAYWVDWSNDGPIDSEVFKLFMLLIFVHFIFKIAVSLIFYSVLLDMMMFSFNLAEYETLITSNIEFSASTDL